VKDFGRWMAEQRAAAPPASPAPTVQIDDDGLPDGLWRRNGKVMASCRACERDYEYDIDPAEGFDQDISYCGGSPRCCP